MPLYTVYVRWILYCMLLCTQCLTHLWWWYCSVISRHHRPIHKFFFNQVFNRDKKKNKEFSFSHEFLLIKINWLKFLTNLYKDSHRKQQQKKKNLNFEQSNFEVEFFLERFSHFFKCTENRFTNISAHDLADQDSANLLVLTEALLVADQRAALSTAQKSLANSQRRVLFSIERVHARFIRVQVVLLKEQLVQILNLLGRWASVNNDGQNQRKKHSYCQNLKLHLRYLIGQCENSALKLTKIYKLKMKSFSSFVSIRESVCLYSIRNDK